MFLRRLSTIIFKTYSNIITIFSSTPPNIKNCKQEIIEAMMRFCQELLSDEPELFIF